MFVTIGVCLFSKEGGVDGPRGQEAGHAMCLTFGLLVPWGLVSLFTKIQIALNKFFAGFAYTEGLVQAGCLVGFQMVFGIMVYAWDLESRRIVPAATYLERPVFLFPVLFVQLLFLQAFLMTAQPF